MGHHCECGSGKPQDECCGTAGCGNMDPVEHTMKSCHEAFMKAHQNALESRMRDRIEKAFGSKLDKVADVTFEAIAKMWKSVIEQSNEKSEVAIQLQKIFSEKQE